MHKNQRALPKIGNLAANQKMDFYDVWFRSVIYPFGNLQEMYESDFQFYTLPNSAMWDSFKHGDDLWKKIYKDMLEPNTEWYKEYQGNTQEQIEWILLDSEHALYANYYQFS